MWLLHAILYAAVIYFTIQLLHVAGYDSLDAYHLVTLALLVALLLEKD